MFNDLVFTPQVSSQVEAELRRNGTYIHTDIRADAAGSTAFLVTSPSAFVGAKHVSIREHSL